MSILPMSISSKDIWRRGAILPIRLYQWTLSPMLPRGCRFTPSCSEYAADAVLEHGIWRGAALALRRLLRCQPWGGHGYDPVPDCGHPHHVAR